MVPNTGLKNRIIQFCRDAGADLIGFASVERWDEANEVPPQFRPQSLWEPARTIIVMGVGMPLPIIETTPSILHKETYTTSNSVLDAMAFNLVRYLIRMGSAAYFFTRDGYSSLRIFRYKPTAAFSHKMAAKYAGLGTVGLSNCLLTPEFGSRVRFVSVFISEPLEPDPVIEKDVCIKCGACAKCCPVDAITISEDGSKSDFHMALCLERHIELVNEKTYPCGICTKACPVGKDRLVYKQKGIMKKYLDEKEALAAFPDDPRYKSWNHVRKYGSWNKDDRAKAVKINQESGGNDHGD